MEKKDLRQVKFFFFLFLFYFIFFLLLGCFAEKTNWALSDQNKYHLPQINMFLSEGFHLYYESSSATTPFSHIFYSLVAFVLGYDVLAAGDKLISVLSAVIVSLTLVLVTYFVYKVSKSILYAVVVSFSLATSQYVFLPAIYATTEGFSYLFYSLALIIPVVINNLGRSVAGFSMATAFLVLTRQIFLPISVSLFMARAVVFSGKKSLWLIALLSSLPILSFAPFVFAWGGLVPPEFSRHSATSINFNVIHQSFALIGFFAMPFALFYDFRSLSPRWLLLLVLVALSLSVLYLIFFPVSFSIDDMRSGSMVWLISYFNDRYFSFPLVNFLLMCFGFFVFLWGVFVDIANRRPPLTSFAFLAYTVALMAQPYAWQRYSEFFVLFTLISFSAFQRRYSYLKIGSFLSFFLMYGALSLIMKV